MNKIEAQLKGLPWTDFKDIPQRISHIYDIILDLNPLAKMVVNQTGEYEMCCEYWFNNTLLIAEGHIKENEPRPKCRGN